MLGFSLVLVGLLFISPVFAYEQIFLRPNENAISTAVIDEATGTAYFGVSEHHFRYSLPGSSGTVVKIRVSPFSRSGTIALHGGENALNAGLLGPGRQTLYFAVYGDPNIGTPGKIVEVQLRDFERTRSVTLGKKDFGAYSAVLEPRSAVAYFGTLFGSLVGVGLKDMAMVGGLGLAKADTPIRTAIIDQASEHAYFGTGTGDVVKVRLSDLSPIASLSVLRDQTGFGAAFLEAGETALFITRGDPVKIVRIRLSDLKPQTTVAMEPGEKELVAAFHDRSTDRLLLVLGTDPTRIVAVARNSLKRLGYKTLPSELGRVTAAVFDTKRRVFLFGTNSSPSRIVRLALQD